MTEATRQTRPPLSRTKPIRNAGAATPMPRAATGAAPKTAAKAATGTARKAAPVGAATGAEPGLDTVVSNAVAHAVRLGYQVLAENLEEGRIAAKQFRVGEYSVRNVPGDLNHLAQRMVNLARDLSTTTFDLLERALQDPAVMNTIQRIAQEPAPREPSAQRSATQAAPVAKASAAGPAKATLAASSPAPFVPLTCQFTGPTKAVVLSSLLAKPPSPTTLATAGLTTLTGGAPITNVTFQPSADGFGVIANVPIPAKQAPGVYSGAVVSGESGVALGALTIQVGA